MRPNWFVLLIVFSIGAPAFANTCAQRAGDRGRDLMNSLEDLMDEAKSYPVGSSKRQQLLCQHHYKMITYAETAIRYNECFDDKDYSQINMLKSKKRQLENDPPEWCY